MGKGLLGETPFVLDKIAIEFPKPNRHFVSPWSGRSVAWLARLFRVQEVVSSNLTAPTILHSCPHRFSAP